MLTAERAAVNDGWFHWFGYWLHFDVAAVLYLERPLYFLGTARDLCLGYGIAFTED